MSSNDSFRVIMPQTARSLFGLSIAVCFISTFFLCLRFWSRALLQQRRFQMDDWTALLAWPFVIGIGICIAIAQRHGFGVHIRYILITDPAVIPVALKVAYVGEMAWVAALGITRSSALLFYNRVFSHAGSNFWKLVVVGVVLNVVWTVIEIFIVIFQCTPIKTIWDRGVNGRCFDLVTLQLEAGITSIVLDCYTFILPMPVVWRLQMNMKKKVLTLITCTLGYCVIVASIGRTVKVVQTGHKLADDVTWYYPAINYWALIEVAFAHICISLPSVFALCHRAHREGLSSLFFRGHDTTFVNIETNKNLSSRASYRVNLPIETELESPRRLESRAHGH